MVGIISAEINQTIPLFINWGDTTSKTQKFIATLPTKLIQSINIRILMREF